MPVAPELFIKGMRQLAAGVTLITTTHEGRRGGLTATAVCSLSAEPPQLLVCINRRLETHAMVEGSGIFAVNLLASDQRPLAEAFGGSSSTFGERRFEGESWTTLVTGSPVLASCLASFDCRVAETLPSSTHTIFIGLVEAVMIESHREPLVYVEGDYGLIAPLMLQLPEAEAGPAW